MGTSGSSPDVSREAVRSVFTRLDEPSTPLTTAEVADELDCPGRAARRNLEDLAEREEVRTKHVGESDRVWWQRGESEAADDSREFSAFVSAVRDYAIFMLDPDGTVVSWNEGAERIKGYRKEEIVGEHFSTFYTDADVEAGVPGENLETAADEGRVEDEGWRVRADGSRFWANVVITAVRDDDGELQGFTKVTRDMTERREYEQQLRRERNQTEQLLRTAPIAIAVQNARGETILANQRAQEALGLTEREILDEPEDADEWGVYDANGDPLDPDETPSARVLATGEPVLDVEISIDPPSGDRMQFLINAAPIFDSDGEIERVVTAGEDITELKKRERQLEQRKTELETELSEILGRISDAFYALDEEWRFTHLNDQAAEILQRSKDELLGREVWELFPDSTGGVYWDQLHTAMETQEPVTFEVHEEGIDTWLEFNVYPSETGLSIYFRDVTGRKERERELARYETIVETINDGIYVKDEDGYFTTVNDAYAELTGYDREELLGAHASLVVDEDTITESWERQATTDEEGTNPTMEAEIRTAGGDTVPTEGALATLQTEDGEHQVGVVRDITERKEHERALRERERRLKRYKEYTDDVLDAIDDIFYLLDGNGELQRWNESLREVTGYSDAEVASMHATELFPEDEHETIANAVAHGFETGTTQVQADVHTRDGERIPYEFVASTLEDPEGAPVLAGIGRDITDRREYERKLEASNERLEQFAYAASHDLQEPLRMVSSYLQLIDRRYGDDLDEDGREFLEFAVDGAERMRNMIEGLLEYSRVETRGDPFEPTDLDSILSDVRDDLQLQIEESDAKITADPLPTVEGDPDQLRRVFQNLLDNAIEYSGDDPPRIDISAERREAQRAPERGGTAAGSDGAKWVISVRDEGIGIDPNDADRIFQVFQRLQGPEEDDGTGIGLALCRRIVERHGGEIWVDSEPGEGATFSFTLPAAGETDA